MLYIKAAKQKVQKTQRYSCTVVVGSKLIVVVVGGEADEKYLPMKFSKTQLRRDFHSTKKMSAEEEPQAKRIKTSSESDAKGILEADVGITEYLSPELTGFKGILKQRYTDFLVNEVLPDGNVLHLTDLGLSDKKDKRRERREAEREEKDSNEGHQQNGEEQPKKNPEPSDEQKVQLIELLGQETYDNMIKLFHTGSKLETDKEYHSKDERTKLHQLIREAFRSRFETRTTPENKFIITLSTDPAKGVRSKTKLEKEHMGTPQEFLQFVLYKENKETMEVANLLTKFLRIPAKQISYAGTKDRRGVTVQKACVSRIKVERLNGLNKALRGVKLGSFEYSATPLRLGDLKGNEFLITIRDVQLADDSNIDDTLEHIMDKAMTSLKTKGFINYYGMQRFGTFSISTHTIGQYVLKSDWKQVVELILSPQELVLPESVEARQVWSDSKDAQKTLSLMPRKCVAEQAILKSLVKDPNGYLNAVMQIPRNLRVMYAHAYQSYVWNKIASERIKRFGLNVVPGDLVIIEDGEENTDEKTPSGDDRASPIEEDIKETQFIRARTVTKEEIETNSKTIFDIVLPSPGFDVIYPENELADVYRQIMEADGVDHQNMKRNIKEFSLAGSYRYVVSKPGNVEWWVKKYDDPTDQLVKTDLDLISEKLSSEDRISAGIENGKKDAVVLKLQLGTSQYATMALREVMKVDTSRRGEGCDVRQASSSKPTEVEEEKA